MKYILVLIVFIFSSAASAAVTKRTATLRLGQTEVRVNVYENPSADITFFAPHFNEQTGRRIAKEYITARGGRLVEIESFDAKGRPARNIFLREGGNSYNIDPNRIFTENGRSCGVPVELRAGVKAFADQILAAIYAGDTEDFRLSGRPIVAVHNNADIDSKQEAARLRDLTAFAFVKSGGQHGIFADQAAGAYLSNAEDDPDNFILLSSADHVSYFGGFGFNVVVQRPAQSLASSKCSIDDGSLSVYSSLNRIPYICLEADAESGELRQRQMFEAVYQLSEKEPIAKR